MTEPHPVFGYADASHLGVRRGDEWWTAAPYKGWRRVPDPRLKFLKPAPRRRRFWRRTA